MWCENRFTVLITVISYIHEVTAHVIYMISITMYIHVYLLESLMILCVLPVNVSVVEMNALLAVADGRIFSNTCYI